MENYNFIPQNNYDGKNFYSSNKLEMKCNSNDLRGVWYIGIGNGNEYFVSIPIF